MNRCPITYEPIADSARYSQRGLHMLSPRMERLDELAYSQAEQIERAREMAAHLSIQGVQPKLSARLNAAAGRLELVEGGGRFILKPQSLLYSELPQNEDLTMRLAEIAGLEVPFHCLIYSKDDSLTYCIRRYDRVSHNGKLRVEDFAQLSGRTRETKYDSSLERVAAIVDTYATFPLVEKERLLRLVLFSFLTGNEDMHLKNFSIITDSEGVTRLTPAYDLINTTIVLPKGAEESALPLRGKKRNITRADILDYYALERLGLNHRSIDETLNHLSAAVPRWRSMIQSSFLSVEGQMAYDEVISTRASRLGLG